MKIKLITGFVFMILLIGSVMAWNTNVLKSNICFQETANTATNCGGMNTGTYSTSGEFGDSWLYLPNPYDGVWNTYGTPNTGSGVNLYINYTKPTNSTNASKVYIKTIRWSNGFLFPGSCWSLDANKISIKIRGIYS